VAKYRELPAETEPITIKQPRSRLFGTAFSLQTFGAHSVFLVRVRRGSGRAQLQSPAADGDPAIISLFLMADLDSPRRYLRDPSEFDNPSFHPARAINGRRGFAKKRASSAKC